MSLRSCTRERELSEILRAGHWPYGCESGLRDHVAGCERCSELVLLKESFHAARADAIAQTTLMHPGLLWWRAQLRRRNEALEKLSRPTRWVSRIALLCALVATIVFLAWQRQYVAEWMGWLGWMSRSNSLRMDSLLGAASSWNWMLVAGCIASLVGFGAVALFVSTNRE